MNSSPLSFEVSDSIAYLTIDDPPRNEMSQEFFDELTFLSNKVLPSLSVRGMIVSGQGRHFSSGANVTSLVTLVDSGEGGRLFRDNHQSFSWIENAPFPIIAAIRGCCFGSGLELALACHYRVAAKRAVFAFPEVEFGLMPGCGGTVRLPELISFGKALEMVMTGRSMLAEEARDTGLVDMVVEKNVLLDTALNCLEVLEKRR